MGGAGTVGDQGSHGGAGDLAFGRYFSLYSAKASGIDLLQDGWKTAALDVAGHFGDISHRLNGFAGPLGNIGGVTGADVWSGGVSARLSALYKANVFLLIPFLKAGVDVAPDAKVWSASILSGAGAVAPSIVLPADRVAPLVEGGLDISSLGGWRLSAGIRYQPASITKTVGGRVTLNVPLL